LRNRECACGSTLGRRALGLRGDRGAARGGASIVPSHVFPVAFSETEWRSYRARGSFSWRGVCWARTVRSLLTERTAERAEKAWRLRWGGADGQVLGTARGGVGRRCRILHSDGARTNQINPAPSSARSNARPRATNAFGGCQTGNRCVIDGSVEPRCRVRDRVMNIRPHRPSWNRER